MTTSVGNDSWADAMSKILIVKKPRKNKTIILSKGKKLSLMKKNNVEDDAESVSTSLNTASILKKNEIYIKGRLKPNILEKENEKKLQKITIKGVVKLFNAVNKHQQSVQDKPETSGPVLTKKEKVMNSVSKSSFLNYLMGDKKETLSTDENDVKMEVKVEGEEESKVAKVTSTWQVLQSNYGIGVKLKDWDNKNNS